ncbi:beta-N-acetylhexosaminidase [Roseivirga echinicomitans]|uniref:beta-N-acetylhexosaminidase n=1 Tax=Roseivirga echinicomitans TaxID=296218 RepID=UPI0009FE688B|nr:family 20 glycosylhydrolase [Roseivirga echinicomitans]
MTSKTIKFTLLFFGLFITSGVLANDFDKYLINPPQELIVTEGCEAFSAVQISQFADFIKSIELSNLTGDLSFDLKGEKLSLSVSIDSTLTHAQGYTLELSQDHIRISAQNLAAAYYAKLTLLQLFSYAMEENATLPCLTIKDWPNFERRGYMLDISRDKVPTMESLYRLIDQLASWKINELQLYTEHTYAYKDHKVVWENSSPLTAEEIRLLDKYCKTRFIDLVPNQNSFGHMENWLKHDEYLDLAECPDDCETIWGKSKRTSLAPTNPASFDLMKSLYEEALPNFSSSFFNIGGDETVELCEGKSEAECEKLGQGRVYLDYLVKLNNEANRLGFKTQFWGDIILNHPELISELPKDMTALVWGYSDDHAFDEQLPKFKAAGLDFYVCPGTSSWRSLIGRNHNAFLNLKNAAISGQENEAKGYLNTNWGDYGHWQPLSVVYPSMLLGASYAWNYQDESLDHLEFQLNHYLFKDKTGNTAKSVLMLGNTYLDTKIPKGNANAFHLLLRRYLWTMQGNYQTKELTQENLWAADSTIQRGLDILSLAEPESEDAQITIDELKQAAALARHGIHLGVARLKAENYDTKSIPAERRKELSEELALLIAQHKALWLVRNREGGLKDSAAKLEDILEFYKDN